MASGFIPIEHYRTKFYQKEIESKRFNEFSEEQLVELVKKVEIKKEIMKELYPNFRRGMPKLERYYKTMQYLTNPTIHLDLRTFDEKAAFLIMMTDPNLVMYKEFLKTNIISLGEIDATTDKKEKARLFLLREQAIAAASARIREQLGFYDSRMLKLEEAFFRKFLSDKELITEVGISKRDELMDRSRILTNFNSISDERYNELVEVAHSWLATVSEKQNSKVAAYSVTNQKKLLGIKTLAEQMALFILLVDSDLDMLRIYEEESRTKNMQDRILDEFGYFSEDLLVLEKKFHKRFCPNKQLSIWTKIKKD